MTPSDILTSLLLVAKAQDRRMAAGISFKKAAPLLHLSADGEDEKKKEVEEGGGKDVCAQAFRGVQGELGGGAHSSSSLSPKPESVSRTKPSRPKTAGAACRRRSTAP